MAEPKYKFGNLHLKNAKEVSDYTTKVIADAENLITNIIPDKIFSLEKLDKEEFQQYSDIASVTSDVNIPSGGYESYMRKDLVNHSYENHNDTTGGGKKKRKVEEMEPDERPPQIPSNAKLLRLIDVMKRAKT